MPVLAVIYGNESTSKLPAQQFGDVAGFLALPPPEQLKRATAACTQLYQLVASEKASGTPGRFSAIWQQVRDVCSKRASNGGLEKDLLATMNRLLPPSQMPPAKSNSMPAATATASAPAAGAGVVRPTKPPGIPSVSAPAALPTQTLAAPLQQLQPQIIASPAMTLSQSQFSQASSAPSQTLSQEPSQSTTTEGRIETAAFSAAPGNRPFKCTFILPDGLPCTGAYVQNNHLMLHMKKHTSERPFACTFIFRDGSPCMATFKSSPTLATHLRLHAGEVARPIEKEKVVPSDPRLRGKPEKLSTSAPTVIVTTASSAPAAALSRPIYPPLQQTQHLYDIPPETSPSRIEKKRERNLKRGKNLPPNAQPAHGVLPSAMFRKFFLPPAKSAPIGGRPRRKSPTPQPDEMTRMPESYLVVPPPAEMLSAFGTVLSPLELALEKTPQPGTLGDEFWRLAVHPRQPFEGQTNGQNWEPGQMVGLEAEKSWHGAEGRKRGRVMIGFEI